MAFTYLERAHLNLFSKLERLVEDRGAGRGGVPILNPSAWLRLLSVEMKIYDPDVVIKTEETLFRIAGHICGIDKGSSNELDIVDELEAQIFKNASRLVLYPDRDVRVSLKIPRGFGVVDDNPISSERSQLVRKISVMLVEFISVKAILLRTDSIVK